MSQAVTGGATADATTAAPASRWLRVRRGGRSRTWRDRLYGLYLAALLVGVYAVPYLIAAVGSGGGALAPLLPHDPDTALALAVLAHALTTCLAVADGTWLGPVIVDPPTLHWLLGTPVSRPQVLRRRWWRALARWTALGAAVGFVLALVTGLGAVRPAPGAPAAGAAGPGLSALALGTLGGAAHGGVCAAVAGAVQVGGHRRAGRAAGVLAGVLATAAVVALLLRAGGVPTVLPSLLSWSGPWGLAARLATAPGGLCGAVAAVLLVLGAVVAVVAATLRVPGVPGALLRARVERLHLMTTAAYSFDFRLARVVTQGAPATASRRVRPPRLPGRPGAAVAWRVVTGWLRRPSNPVAGAGLLTASVATAAVAAPAPDAPGVVITLAVLAPAYAGAAALVEAVRAETDDVTRSRVYPLRFRSLVLRLLAPAVVLGAGVAAVAVLAVAVVAPSSSAVPVAVLAGVPALVAAAGVSACRGAFPVYLLIGSETPMGNTGPVQAALWFLRAPLAALAMLAPVLWWAAPQTRPLPMTWAWLAAVPAPVVAGYLVAVTAGILLWARGRADGLYRGWR